MKDNGKGGAVLFFSRPNDLNIYNMSEQHNAAVITPATATTKAAQPGRLGNFAFRTYNNFVYRMLPAAAAKELVFKNVQEMKDCSLAIAGFFAMLIAVSFAEKGGLL